MINPGNGWPARDRTAHCRACCLPRSTLHWPNTHTLQGCSQKEGLRCLPLSAAPRRGGLCPLAGRPSLDVSRVLALASGVKLDAFSVQIGLGNRRPRDTRFTIENQFRGRPWIPTHRVTIAFMSVSATLTGITAAACHRVQRSNMWEIIWLRMNSKSSSTCLLSWSGRSVLHALLGPGFAPEVSEGSA